MKIDMSKLYEIALNAAVAHLKSDTSKFSNKSPREAGAEFGARCHEFAAGFAKGVIQQHKKNSTDAE